MPLAAGAEGGAGRGADARLVDETERQRANQGSRPRRRRARTPPRLEERRPARRYQAFGREIERGNAILWYKGP